MGGVQPYLRWMASRKADFKRWNPGAGRGKAESHVEVPRSEAREREGTLKIWRQGHLELTGSVGLLSPALTANFFAFRPADSQGCHRELMTGP